MRVKVEVERYAKVHAIFTIMNIIPSIERYASRSIYWSVAVKKYHHKIRLRSEFARKTKLL